MLPPCDRAASTRWRLDPLAAEAFPHLEIIRADDGSRDATPAMLERFVADYPDSRLVVLRRETTRGANESRNRGVQVGGAVTGLVLDPPSWTIDDLTATG